MKQDMIVILDLGCTENTATARAIRALGVYSEIYPHDVTPEELAALPNVKGVILNGGPNRVVDGVPSTQLRRFTLAACLCWPSATRRRRRIRIARRFLCARSPGRRRKQL